MGFCGAAFVGERGWTAFGHSRRGGFPSKGTLRMIITWPKAWSQSCLEWGWMGVWVQVAGVMKGRCCWLSGPLRGFGELGVGQFNTWEGTPNTGINLKTVRSSRQRTHSWCLLRVEASCLPGAPTQLASYTASLCYFLLSSLQTYTKLQF